MEKTLTYMSMSWNKGFWFAWMMIGINIYSCDSFGDIPQGNEYHKCKVVKFPEIYTESSNIASEILDSKKGKILIYLNAECSKCMGALNVWYNNISKINKNDGSWGEIIIAYGPSKPLFEHWIETSGLQLDFVWDESREIAALNSWLDTNSSYFFVLNSSNDVLFSQSSNQKILSIDISRFLDKFLEETTCDDLAK